MICSKKYIKYTFSQKNSSIGLDIKGICMAYFGCTTGVLRVYFRYTLVYFCGST